MQAWADYLDSLREDASSAASYNVERETFRDQVLLL
jgi:hypothetical protein